MSLVHTIRELRVRWPISRRECWECPGALYLRWPGFGRVHRWQDDAPTIGPFGSTVHEIFLDYDQTCTVCGIHRVWKGLLTLSHESALDFLTYMGHPQPDA